MEVALQRIIGMLNQKTFKPLLKIQFWKILWRNQTNRNQNQVVVSFALIQIGCAKSYRQTKKD